MGRAYTCRNRKVYKACLKESSSIHIFMLSPGELLQHLKCDSRGKMINELLYQVIYENYWCEQLPKPNFEKNSAVTL